MVIKTAFSQAKSSSDAVNDIARQLNGQEAAAVLFFASPVYPPDRISETMHAAFPRAQVFGCTTAGEIISNHMLKESIVAMAFDRQMLPRLEVAVLDNVKADKATLKKNVESVFARFGAAFGVPPAQMDPSEFIGIILIDGLSGAEEKVMEVLGELSDIIFIGGSAGDDMAFKQTHVFSEGKAYSNAAVLALMKPAGKFDVIKTQSFKVLDKKLTASKVDEATREVLEFNGKPAVKAYADALGVAENEVADQFMAHPVGLMVSGDPYVRSPQQVKGDGIVFYCSMRQGMELSLLESGNIITDTRKAIEEKKQELGGISGMINFHCILRTLELEKQHLQDDYAKVFADVPTVGFSTYGEAYLGHVNQTSTMLVFK